MNCLAPRTRLLPVPHPTGTVPDDIFFEWIFLRKTIYISYVKADLLQIAECPQTSTIRSTPLIHPSGEPLHVFDKETKFNHPYVMS